MSARLLAPFAGLRVAPRHADAVLAPPYDVLSTEEARAAVQGRPWSFLHVSRPEIDLPPETPPNAPALYDGAAAAFSRMIEDGVLIRDQAPRFYAWRMEAQGRAQTGLVAAASLAAYEQGAIKRHESTRPPKVEDRARHIEALGAQTGPLFLIHRPDDEVRRLIAAACENPPLCRSVLDGAVTHTLWPIDDADGSTRWQSASTGSARSTLPTAITAPPRRKWRRRRWARKRGYDRPPVDGELPRRRGADPRLSPDRARAERPHTRRVPARDRPGA